MVTVEWRVCLWKLCPSAYATGKLQVSAIVLGFYTLTEMYRVRNTGGTQLLVTMWSGEVLIHCRWNNKMLHLPNLMTEHVSVFYNCMFLIMYSSICSICFFFF